jgi:hypothetical protein
MSASSNSWSDLYRKEDWWSIWFGAILAAVVGLGFVTKVPKVGKWTSNPLEALPTDLFLPLIGLMAGIAVMTVIGIVFMQLPWQKYLGGFVAIFIMATLSYVVANQASIKAWGLSYAVWALGVGLLISNTIGTPGGCWPAPRARCSSRPVSCCWVRRFSSARSSNWAAQA